MPVQRITTSVALVSPVGSTVAALSGASVQLSLDEGSAPYVTARVECAMPSAAQFAMMRPGAGYYLSILTYPESSPETVPVLLRITDRNRGTTGNVELQAASAEVDLMGYTPSVVDTGNWSRQNDVASIIAAQCNASFTDWSRYTYSDADSFGQDIGVRPYPTFRAQTNLIPNGSFERDTTGWATANCSIARSSTYRKTGTYSLQTTNNSARNESYAAVDDLGATAGGVYTASGSLYLPAALGSGQGADSRRILVTAIRNAKEEVIARSPQTANTAGQWLRTSVTFTVPSNATQVRLRLENSSPASSNASVYWDEVMVIEGTGTDTDGITPVPYFDGDTTNTSAYNYTWSSNAGASASARTPVIARDPEALTWSPGQSAWDFLQPILQAVGVRLWSPGYAVLNGKVVARIHWATNMFGLTRAAPRVLDGYNLFDLSQVDSWSATFSDGTPMYADQVIIHYAWTDNLGNAQEAYDVYPATGRKPYFLDKSDTPYPGAGRAQGIYNRISARATVFQGTTWFNRAIEPGRQLSITSALAAGGSALGYIEAVTWDPGRGTTEFRTKQTVAYTSASWFAATGSWASQTGSWAADF